jgi:hypothetical protein
MKRSPINKVSKKRLAEIASGLRTANGALKYTAEQYRAIASKKTSKQTDKQRAMKAADKWFSEWIRLRDAGRDGNPDGLVKCVTCPRVAHWRDMDCGHYASRAKQATRYDEDNAHAQCGGCNRFQGGKFIEHAALIDSRYGPGSASLIAHKAMMRCKRTADDFQRIADDYHARVILIRDCEPQKYHRQP